MPPSSSRARSRSSGSSHAKNASADFAVVLKRRCAAMVAQRSGYFDVPRRATDRARRRSGPLAAKTELSKDAGSEAAPGPRATEDAGERRFAASQGRAASARGRQESD